jgi:hypothetical protein
MSHWSLVVFCQNYIVPLPVLFLLSLLLLLVEQCNSDRKQPRTITHKIINNNKDNKNKKGSGTIEF